MNNDCFKNSRKQYVTMLKTGSIYSAWCVLSSFVIVNSNTKSFSFSSNVLLFVTFSHIGGLIYLEMEAGPVFFRP